MRNFFRLNSQEEKQINSTMTENKDNISNNNNKNNLNTNIINTANYNEG